MKNLIKSVLFNDLKNLKNSILRGEDPNELNKFGNCPLVVAIRENNIECFEELLKHPNINLNSKNKSFGYTPLMTAVFDNKFDIVRLLIEAGADVNCVSYSGHTPLMEALNKKSSEIASYLIENKANLDFIGELGYIPFFIAIQNNKYDVFKLMMNKSFNMLYEHENYNSACLNICLVENEQMAKELCKKAHDMGEIRTIKSHLEHVKTKYEKEPNNFYYYFNSMVNSIIMHDNFQVLNSENNKTTRTSLKL